MSQMATYDVKSQVTLYGLLHRLLSFNKTYVRTVSLKSVKDSILTIKGKNNMC